MRMKIMCGLTFPRLFSQPACHLFFIAVVIFGVGVGLSDGASVQIPESKILMDHTSSSLSQSLPSATLRFKVTSIISQPSPVSPSSPKGLKKMSKKGIAAVEAVKTETSSNTGSVQEDKEKVEEIRAPVHVAQCRATCLEKFTLMSTSSNRDLKNNASMTSKMDDEIRLLRLKRKKRSSTPIKFSTCIEQSSECLSCWKSCQLLEIGSNNVPSGIGNNPEDVLPSNNQHSPLSPLPSVVDADEEESGGGPVNKQVGKVGTEMEETTKSKHPILSCSRNNNSNSKQRCMAGCQVACSFYERLLTNNGRAKMMASDEPVVATKHQSVVKIVPGKITWPAPSTLYSGNDEKSQSDRPMVYVVIQEYPDRKWRQISQTTELELGIPSELTTAMKTKLGSVRVLVVGPEGLQFVYSPVENTATTEQKQVSAEKKAVNKSGKVAVISAVDKERGDASSTAAVSEAIIFRTETNDDGGNNKRNNVNEKESSESDGNVTQEPPEENGTVPTALTSPTIKASSLTRAPGVVTLLTNEPFELRLVSLIHQKSLVIAELRWDEIGGNPNQDYLITWELTGGGLKGHLVTDSTSVTLSLWPDTTYQIQVEQFQQNLDSDGEQPAPDDSSSLKSSPLIVDTSIASFPLERPSALLSSDSDEEEENDYQHDEDEFTAEEGPEEEEDDDEQPGHKSIGQVLGVAIASLVLVLVILTLVAFIWAKLQMLYARKSCEKVDDDESCFGGSENAASSCFSCCFNGCVVEEKDARLFASQEDLHSEDSASFHSSPMHYVLSLKRSQYGNKKRNGNNSLECSFADPGQQDEEFGCAMIRAPVAVISSASSFPAAVATGGDISNGPAASQCSLLDGYYDNVFGSSSGLSSSSLLAPADWTTRNCYRS